MLKIKITKKEKMLMDMIESGEFFDHTYLEVSEKLGDKTPQYVINHINALENKGMITTIRGIKKRKGKGYDEIHVNKQPEYKIIYE